jgi:internalin A
MLTVTKSVEPPLDSSEQVYLAGNNLKVLPNTFPIHLQIIDLSFNNLKELPSSFNQPKLEILDLRSNRFSSIPQQIYKHHNIQQLYLNCNFISQIDSRMRGMLNLSKLDLSYNELTCISYDNFPICLEYLDLTHNMLETIPRYIGNLTNLKSLLLNFNKLHSLPILSNLKKLEVLEISNNNLRFITKGSFDFLHELKSLILNRNTLLKELPDLSDLISLQLLDISECSIIIVPISVGKLLVKTIYNDKPIDDLQKIWKVGQK